MMVYTGINITRVKQLIRYCKKYTKMGAYMEINEVTYKDDKTESYDVTLYIPTVRIDKNGKMRLKENDAK